MLCFNAQDILWVWAVVFPSVMYLATVGTYFSSPEPAGYSGLI